MCNDIPTSLKLLKQLQT